MSGTKIRGITIELGGDTTGLSKALKDVNKDISSTQRQLKDVERLLKLDPGNTELLRQKQLLLNQAVEETGAKLESLKKAEKQVQEQFKKGEVSEEQYNALKREIIQTENALEELENRADKSSVFLSKIGVEAGKAAEKLDKAAQKTKLLSGAAAAGIAGMAGMAYNAGLAADDLNTLSKQSGFSTEQLQIWQYGADRVDASMEDIVSSAAKMKKNMVSTSVSVTGAWDKLGISVKDSNGELRDSTDVFNETIRALSKIENETERDTIAMTLFGKGADSLATLIDDGGEAFRQYGEEAKEAGLILSQDALDSANEFNDAMDKLKAQTTGTFAEVGTEVATMLLPYIEELAEKIQVALEWVRGLDEGQLKMIGTILLLVAALSPTLSLLSNIANGIQMVSSAINFLIANPIVMLIAAIVALVLLVATKGDELQGILQKIDDFLQNIFAVDWTTVFGPVIGEAINVFMANMKNMWSSLNQILNGIIDFIRGVFTGDWERAWTGIVNIFGGIFSGLETMAKIPINGIIGLINGAISGLNILIKGANKIPGVDIDTIDKIPYLAKGGILSQGSAVVGEAGPELLTMMGNKAVVQPLTNQTTNHTELGGMNVYVYGAPGQDVSELADIIENRIAEKVQRRGVVFG